MELNPEPCLELCPGFYLKPDWTSPGALPRGLARDLTRSLFWPFMDLVWGLRLTFGTFRPLASPPPSRQSVSILQKYYRLLQKSNRQPSSIPRPFILLFFVVILPWRKRYQFGTLFPGNCVPDRHFFSSFPGPRYQRTRIIGKKRYDVTGLAVWQDVSEGRERTPADPPGTWFALSIERMQKN